jgi:vitamin-K-epoxide reductase (warfarin-sensitive)
MRGLLTMRYTIAILAVAGIIVSALALHVHYSNGFEPCDINARWDCGVVNHSRYSMLFGIPVALIGIAGYAAIALAAFLRRFRLVFGLALAGLVFSLYLSRIEAQVLQVWCLYCAISQFLIALLVLLGAIGSFLNRTARPRG